MHFVFDYIKKGEPFDFPFLFTYISQFSLPKAGQMIEPHRLRVSSLS